MNPVFRQQCQITEAQCNPFGYAKNSALLLCVQDIAEAHCNLLGADRQTLEKENLFWALVRNKMEITRHPSLGETIILETFPLPTTKTNYPRGTIAYDKDGNELFRTLSLWVLMHWQTRRLILPHQSNIEVPGNSLIQDSFFTSQTFPRTAPQNRALSHSCHTVTCEDLDQNLHVNNTRYVDWVMKLLPEDFLSSHPLRQLTVSYHNEAKESQKVSLNYAISPENSLQVEGLLTEADATKTPIRVFTAQAQF